MLNIRRFALPTALFLLSASAATAETISTDSSQSGYTQLPTGTTTVFSEDSDTLFVGRNLVSCFRFSSAAIPKSAFISEATLDIECENCNNTNVRFRICGEYTATSEEFEEKDFNLSDRQWSRGCTSPTDYDSLTPQSFDVKSVVQDIVNNQAWTTGNALSLCFLDVGSRAKNRVSSSAELSVSFDRSGAGGGGSSLDCWLDTTGEGIADTNFPDADGDGYCDFPVGTAKVSGLLAFDRPFEVLRGAGTGANGIIFDANEIRLVENGVIISDLQSPVSSSADGNTPPTLAFKAAGAVTLANGVISNVGFADDFGDLTVSTDRLGAPITIDGPWVVARKIRVSSNGPIIIKGETTMSADGEIALKALGNGGGFDISVGGDTSIEVSAGNKIIFDNASPGGRLIFEPGTTLSADEINLCNIQGGNAAVIGLEDAVIWGDLVLPDDDACPTSIPIGG